MAESPGRIVVVDVETTGVTNRDRIVEVAAVVLDDNLKVVEEYDTLVDPQRDVGPSDIHGITPSMVSAAPTFEEVAAALAVHIHGSILVAHNLTFDSRMLSNEYKRASARFMPGKGICTLRLTGQRLSEACRRHRVGLVTEHRALADARATAELLARILDDQPEGVPAQVQELHHPLNPRTLRREASAVIAGPLLARLVSSTPYPTSHGGMLSYLNALDWVLDDLVITSVEAEHLRGLADDLNLTPEQVGFANRQYMQLLVLGALRDGIITEEEHQLMGVVAKALGLRNYPIPKVSEMPSVPTSLPKNCRVCFTGTAVGLDGQKIDRHWLEAEATKVGLQPVSGVTKNGCDLLVAADPTSASGKAKKARKYGLPIMSIMDFCSEMRIS